MADIIKTWPAVVNPHSTARMFHPHVPTFHRYYFTIGQGRPKQKIERLWFTYGGRILGYFNIEEVIQNDGPDAIPRLNRLDGGQGDWQIRKDAWVAICTPPCVRLKERLYYSGFQGFRYFNIEEYRGTLEARCRL